MDYHYRGAIHNLEQADQLINKATSPADIERGVNEKRCGEEPS
jgi:cell division ATPase FtsA